MSARAELSYAGGLDIDQIAEKAVTVQANQPLAVFVSATPNPVVAGDRLFYEITVSNVSNVSDTPLSAVWVYYRIPQEIAAFSRTMDVFPDASFCTNNDNDNDNGLCSSGEELQWSPGTLVAGASSTLQINAPIAEGLADGTLITVPINVTATDLVDRLAIEKTVVIGSP